MKILLNTFIFFKDGFWKIRHDKNKPIKSFFIKSLRILFLSSKGFFKDECYLKSAILTFYTLISITPFLAILLAISKGFGFDVFVKNSLLSIFKEQHDVLAKIFEFSNFLILYLKSNVIIAIGILFLFFSIFGLFENIEKSLNFIWKIKKKRFFLTRIVNYLAVLITMPILFALSISLTIFINSALIKTVSNISFLKNILESAALVNFLTLILVCILFSIIYLFIPIGKIFFKSRIFAGFLAGIFFQIWQIIYITFLVKIASYNAVFGSFAAIPLFFIWLQINYAIFYFCAEIAAQTEDDKFYSKSKSSDTFTNVDEKIISLLILSLLTQNFLVNKPSLRIDELSDKLGISFFSLRSALYILEKNEIIIEKRNHYRLVNNPELLTINKINDLIDDQSISKFEAKITSSLQLISQKTKKLNEIAFSSKENITLKELAIALNSMD